jgi:hypothetical protein
LIVNYQRVVRAFVASPGDVSEERDALCGVVDELNQTWADFLATRLDLIMWETHSWPAVGADAQDVIFAQTGDEHDLFIGIIGAKWGTPTPRASSGTADEFERAHQRFMATGLPDIMFYFRVTEDPVPQVAQFREDLARRGVYYWCYRDVRRFEQSCRIHLSRQLQRLVRRKTRLRVDPSFPQTEESLLRGLRTINSLVGSAVDGGETYVDVTKVITELTSDLALSMGSTTSQLRRYSRPGFRKRSGGMNSIVRPLVMNLNDYATKLDRLRPSLIRGYSQLVGDFGRAVAIVAPLSPLPALLRPALESTLPSVNGLQRTISKLRTGIEGARQAIADWPERVPPPLTAAKRRSVEALDLLDLEISGSLHLTRELERAVEEILRD